MKIPAGYISYPRTCRICKSLIDDQRSEVKYSTRHYAHPKCFIDRFGEKIVTMIPDWKLELLPYKSLEDAGILEFVRDYLLQQKKVSA